MPCRDELRRGCFMWDLRQKAWRVRLLELWGTFVESSCSLAKTHIEKDDISIIAQISKEIIILVFFIWHGGVILEEIYGNHQYYKYQAGEQ